VFQFNLMINKSNEHKKKQRSFFITFNNPAQKGYDIHTFLDKVKQTGASAATC